MTRRRPSRTEAVVAALLRERDLLLERAPALLAGLPAELIEARLQTLLQPLMDLIDTYLAELAAGPHEST